MTEMERKLAPARNKYKKRSGVLPLGTWSSPQLDDNVRAI